MDADGDFYKDILDHIGDGVYFVDKARRVTYWNRGAERISGYSEDQVLGHLCADGLLVHVDENGTKLCERGCPLAATMSDGQVREAHVYLRHAKGHREPVFVRAMPMYDKRGRLNGAVETFSDNSSLLAALKRVKEVSAAVIRDPLTGVGNRRHLELRIESCLAECQKLKTCAGVLLADVDHFQEVNEKYGHAVGDEALKMVANTLKSSLRSWDSLGRWSGGEFMALVLEVDRRQLLATAEKLRMLVANSHLSVGPEQVQVTVSVGATLTRPGDTRQTLVERVETLLGQSKAEGRNRVSAAA